MCAAVAALLLMPAYPAASGTGPGGPGDGTLSVKRGRGTIALNIRGAMIVRVAKGRITAKDPDITDGSGLGVAGCDNSRVDRSDDFPDVDVVKFCKGTDLRLRAIGGRYQIAITGSGINLSLVGRGIAVIDGSGGDGPDGVYSVNDGDYQSLPDETKRIPITAPPEPG